jgi:selenide,water dikinase
MKKLLIIGGGHAHVEVLRRFGLRKLEGVEITVVSPDRHTPYSGMLPGLVAGHYTFEQCHIDLQPLAAYAGARLVLGEARSLDATRRVLTLSDGSALSYDIASINTGSLPLAQDLPGVAEHAIAVKPVAEFLIAWEKLIARVRAGEVRSIAVVGGGAAGVEILLAMQHRFAQMQPSTDLQYHLITDTRQLLAQHARGVRAVLEQSLSRKGVNVHRLMRVTRVETAAVIASDADQREQRIDADAVVWITGAAAPAWLAHSGLAINDEKFININKYLQSTSHVEVFAAGDCATLESERYPKSGVYAVRQGPVLAENLRAALNGAALAPYAPQPRALALISTGERHAIASWGGLSFHGNWVWRWKDRIDQAFMAKYRALPARSARV